MNDDEEKRKYEEIFNQAKMSDEEFRKDSELSFQLAVTRGTDGVTEQPDPCMMPWLEVVHVQVDPETGSIGERQRCIYALAISEEDKPKVMFKIGRDLGEPGKNILPIVAFFTAEAWVSRHKDRPDGKYVRPIDDPQSKDAIIMIGCTMDRRISNATQYVEHQKDGRTKIVGEPTWFFSMDPEVKVVKPGVLMHLWRGYFSRFLGVDE